MARSELPSDAPLASIWGFAEATLFFVAPDVLLSYLALDSRRRALIGCVWVGLGALVGGAVMYTWGARDPRGATETLERLPAISRSMIDEVETSMRWEGGLSAFVGAFTGRPFKVFAVEAGNLGMGLGGFLLLSIPARFVRFVAVSLTVAWISRRLAGRWSPRRKRIALALFWILFYTAFFLWMAG